MSLLSTDSRSNSYQPGLAWFATLGGIWVFVLVMLGAFTTSIGAGMIFLDWPLSNGSLNPEGWLNDIMMFAEHSHRLSAGMMSIITIAIWAAVWKKEARAWVRNVALFAVVLVLVQALVGGLRVMLDHIFLDSVSVGRLFAMLHACLPPHRRALADERNLLSHILYMAQDGFAISHRLNGPSRRMDAMVDGMCGLLLG